MNQLVPFHSGQAPVLIAAAGEHARVRFIEFFTAKSAIPTRGVTEGLQRRGGKNLPTITPQ
jgi:hypothetical protein